MAAGGKLRLLALIPLTYRTHIPDNPGIDLRNFAAGRTLVHFPPQVTVIGADGKRRGKGKIGQMVVAAYCFDK